MVCQVLAQCQLAVCLQSRKHFNVVEEVYHYLSTFVEAFSIACCPPVTQVTVLVELASLIIESMSHFVSDHNADSSIVEGIVSIHVEERILKNSGREADFVG